MLNVKTPEEVFKIINICFRPVLKTEPVQLCDAAGRVLSEDITSNEYIPGFNRSTVDGFAVKASDTFGCSESIPAILNLQGSILMGKTSDEALEKGCCFEIPTGGFVPAGADAVVMIEHTEDYGDGTVGILSPVAPGKNMVFKGDDLKPGEVVLCKGRRLNAADIGSLASMGITNVKVHKKIKVGIISTGDELVPISESPKPGQIRNVNSVVLAAVAFECGANAIDYGIAEDDETLITDTILKAASECDVVLISGGSSAGEKDNTAKIIAEHGELLLHGIAIKPGKPTIIGKINGKPVIGMPGHPGASFFIAEYFVKQIIRRLQGEDIKSKPKALAVLDEAVDSNHGRAEILAVKLTEKEDGFHAKPVISKSGLITGLAQTDGYIYIDRNCEGLEKGCQVEVHNGF